jgi:hypothetical protein
LEEGGISNFFGNIRSLRAGKQSRKMSETKKLLRRNRKATENDIKNEYDSDEDTSQLLSDYYQDKLNLSALSDETSNSNLSFISRKQAIGHLVMFLAFVEIWMLYVKNSVITDPSEYGYYSFLAAFGLPMSVICLSASDLLYEKYIAKFEQSHKVIYKKFLILLVTMTASSILFVLTFSIYLSEPNSLEIFGILAFVPFYLCWMISVGLFIFISPGLMDPTNNIPFYQVVMAGIYLAFAFFYPIYLSIIVANQNLTEVNKGNPEISNPN